MSKGLNDGFASSDLAIKKPLLPSSPATFVRVDLRYRGGSTLRQPLVLASLLTLLLSAPAGATSLSLTGTVTDIFGTPPPLSFGVGETITGSLTWDDGAADTDGDPARGFYPGALTILTLEIDGNVWTVAGGDVEIVPATFDPIQLTGSATGPSLGAFGARDFLLDFDDPTDFIVTDALPVGDGAFAAAISPGSISMNYGDSGGGTFEIEAIFSYAIVPEPSTAALLALGIGALGALNRQQTLRPVEDRPRGGCGR